jgi:hypothetical protein
MMQRKPLDTSIPNYRYASLRGDGCGFAVSFLAWSMLT